MQTSLYKILFKDGREYRVFCANASQIQRFRRVMLNQKDYSIEPIINGIHTFKQFEDIINNLK